MAVSGAGVVLVLRGGRRTEEERTTDEEDAARTAEPARSRARDVPVRDYARSANR
jgi:hypothetical protein